MKYNPKIVCAYLVECALPEPHTEWPVCDGRKFRFDFAWPLLNVALEVEGGIYTRQAHGSVTGILRDIDKQNCWTLAGWRVLRILPDKVCTQETVAMLKRLMCL